MKLFYKSTVIASVEQRNEAISILLKGLFLCVLLSSFAFEGSAQCKSYTKKHCLPSLSPYIHNGQLTSAVLNPGDSADILLTFNAGKEYRLLVCNQEQIGQVQFKVLDPSGKMLYESEGENPSWDFKVENTQQLTVQLVVPKTKNKSKMTRLTPNGCVALLVGFKE